MAGRGACRGGSRQTGSHRTAGAHGGERRLRGRGTSDGEGRRSRTGAGVTWEPRGHGGEACHHASAPGVAGCAGAACCAGAREGGDARRLAEDGGMREKGGMGDGSPEMGQDGAGGPGKEQPAQWEEKFVG